MKIKGISVEDGIDYSLIKIRWNLIQDENNNDYEKKTHDRGGENYDAGVLLQVSENDQTLKKKMPHFGFTMKNIQEN